MARHFSSSQFRSRMTQLQNQLRQNESRRRQALDRVRQGFRDYERKTRQAVDDYNRAVRAHNARVQTARTRLQQELARLRSASSQPPQPVTVSQRITVTARRQVTVSATSVHDAFARLEERRAAYPEHLFEMFEEEAANSLRVANVLDGREAAADEEVAALQSTVLSGELRAFAPELEDRWKGALFALNPQNPDAARHFCTSARECIVKILDVAAPEGEAVQRLPDPKWTDDGKLTRRSKLKFLLVRKGLVDDAVEEFVNEDVEDILRLFGVFNAATHGEAGRFDLNQLAVVKQRAESGILFLHHLAN